MSRMLIAAAVVAASLAAPATAAELKVAVVDVSEVLARYKKTEDLKQAAQEKLREREKKLGERSREYQTRVAELATASIETTPAEALKRKRELEVEKALIEFDIREFHRLRKDAETRIMRAINDDIAAICRRIGEAEGYDLILKRYSPPGGLAADQTRVEVFRLSPVLYAAGHMDVTSRVLEALEEAYARGLKLVPESGALPGKTDAARTVAETETTEPAAPAVAAVDEAASVAQADEGGARR